MLDTVIEGLLGLLDIRPEDAQESNLELAVLTSDLTVLREILGTRRK